MVGTRSSSSSSKRAKGKGSRSAKGRDKGKGKAEPRRQKAAAPKRRPKPATIALPEPIFSRDLEFDEEEYKSLRQDFLEPRVYTGDHCSRDGLRRQVRPGILKRIKGPGFKELGKRIEILNKKRDHHTIYRYLKLLHIHLKKENYCIGKEIFPSFYQNTDVSDYVDLTSEGDPRRKNGTRGN